MHAKRQEEDIALLQDADGGKIGARLKVAMGCAFGANCFKKPLAASGRADYFGPLANLAARVMGQAHPGQVLVAELQDGAPPPAGGAGGCGGFSLIDVGAVKLKGIQTGTFVYDVRSPALESLTFLPPKGLVRVKTPESAPHTRYQSRDGGSLRLRAWLSPSSSRNVGAPADKAAAAAAAAAAERGAPGSRGGSGRGSGSGGGSDNDSGGGCGTPPQSPQSYPLYTWSGGAGDVTVTVREMGAAAAAEAQLEGESRGQGSEGDGGVDHREVTPRVVAHGESTNETIAAAVAVVAAAGPENV